MVLSGDKCAFRGIADWLLGNLRRICYYEERMWVDLFFSSI